MNHLSIGIIRKKTSNDVDKFEYLIIEGNQEFKFFEATSIAIGATFDFAAFRKKIIEYFDLPKSLSTDSTSTDVDFQVPPTFFKSSRREPEATAYLYELSQPQIDAINGSIHTLHGKWSMIRWLSEQDLKNRPWKKTQAFLFERESPFNPPEFSNDFRASLKKIVAAKENGKLVIFAGAGVSVDSQVPGWATLVDELKNDLSTTEADFLKVAELYHNSRGEKEYHERVQEILKSGKTTYNPVHQKILELDPVHVVTTNYDSHFEQVIESKGLPYSIIRADSDFPYSKSSSLFVKMHGDFSLRNIVLRKTDYDNYEDCFPLILSFVRETFASKLVLFVGFSFSDENLKSIISSVRQILKKDIQQPYLFSNLESESEVRDMKKTLHEQGVRVLQYEDAIDEYFAQIRTLADEGALAVLNDKSQKVYKLLKVIEEFDMISDSLENKEIKEQFIHSLERFKELGSIPVDVIMSMTPFKIKRQPKGQDEVKAQYNYYDPFHLETLNEDLLTFLKGMLVNDEIPFLTYRDIGKTQEAQRLDKCLKLVYSSGIHCIRRKSDTESKHFRLEPVNQSNKQCGCVRCLYDRYDFKKLIYSLTSLSAKALCKSDFYDEGLLEAYGFLKAGQIIKSFYALEEARRVSLKSELYITYFIASYNQTLLRPMLRIFYEANYEEGEVDKVIQKIDTIDLYTILHNLPVARDIKQCLKLVIENNVYKVMFSKMEDDFETIKKTYSSYKRRGYSSSGPNYWYRLQGYYFLVWNFYHKNLLFNDEHHNFSKMTYLYCESMIASHMISDRYDQKLKTIPGFFFQVVVQYGYASDTIQLFKQYDVINLGVVDSDQEDLVSEFCSFLASGYERSSLFGDTILKENVYTGAVESSSYLRNRIVRTFNNFLTVLMHIDLTKSQVNRIADELVNFLSVSEIFEASNSHEYVSRFVRRCVWQFDESRIQKIASYILSENIWSTGLIGSFCEAFIFTRKIENLFGEELYYKLRMRVEKKDKRVLRHEETIPFYLLLKPTQREMFSKLTADYMDTQNDRRWHTLTKAYYWKMWNPITNKNLFDPFFEHVVSLSVNFPKYEITDEGEPIGDDFQPWNNMHVAIHIIYSYQLFSLPFVASLRENLRSNMFQWILAPTNFDYSLFDQKWILAFGADEIRKGLRGNPELIQALEGTLEKSFAPKIAEVFYTQLK